MPKPRAIARNADRNPNLGGTDMKGKHGYKMPKEKTQMSYRQGPESLKKNSLRDKNLKRMHKGMSHNPGY